MNSENWQERTQLLLGEENITKLQQTHVLIIGLGGVGGYAAEQLCRAGIGKLTLVDSDVIQPSNRNRQIIALKSTEGQKKTDTLKRRLLDINPDLVIHDQDIFVNENNIFDILNSHYDFIIDAIDTLTPKVTLLEEAYKRKFRIVSSMGSAGRLDPSKVEIADISKSHHCRFAYVVRKYLHRKGIYSGIQVVFSSEPAPKRAIQATDGENNKRSTVGTISYMPAIFGCFCASVVLRDLLKD
ncbi:MAG: tRNA threonylcarbamoyladenosine dehydratase [Bacteroidales bacterium]|nr:tRNA threonylcarbamoyladenosine dehydratase [Bacteroidales bacterium]